MGAALEITASNKHEKFGGRYKLYRWQVWECTELEEIVSPLLLIWLDDILK